MELASASGLSMILKDPEFRRVSELAGRDLSIEAWRIPGGVN